MRKCINHKTGRENEMLTGKNDVRITLLVFILCKAVTESTNIDKIKWKNM